MARLVGAKSAGPNASTLRDGNGRAGRSNVHTSGAPLFDLDFAAGAGAPRRGLSGSRAEISRPELPMEVCLLPIALAAAVLTAFTVARDPGEISSFLRLWRWTVAGSKLAFVISPR